MLSFLFQITKYITHGVLVASMVNGILRKKPRNNELILIAVSASTLYSIIDTIGSK